MWPEVRRVVRVTAAVHRQDNQQHTGGWGRHIITWGLLLVLLLGEITPQAFAATSGLLRRPMGPAALPPMPETMNDPEGVGDAALVVTTLQEAQRGLPSIEEQEESQYDVQAICSHIRILFRIASQALLQRRYDVGLDALKLIRNKQAQLLRVLEPYLKLVVEEDQSVTSSDGMVGVLLLPLSLRQPLELLGLSAQPELGLGPLFSNVLPNELLDDLTAWRRNEVDGPQFNAEDLKQAKTVLDRVILRFEELRVQQAKRRQISDRELTQLNVLLVQQELSIESLRQAFHHPWIEAFLLIRQALAEDATPVIRRGYLAEARTLLGKKFFSYSLTQNLSRFDNTMMVEAVEKQVQAYWDSYIDALERVLLPPAPGATVSAEIPGASPTPVAGAPFCPLLTPEGSLRAPKPDQWIPLWLPVIRQARYLSLLKYSAFSPILQQFDKRRGRLVESAYYRLYTDVMPRLVYLMTVNRELETLAVFQESMQGVRLGASYDHQKLGRVVDRLYQELFKSGDKSDAWTDRDATFTRRTLNPWVASLPTMTPQQLVWNQQAEQDSRRASTGMFLLFERITLKPNQNYLLKFVQ